MQLSIAEKLKLTKELSGVRASINGASIAEKLKLVKRVGEIRVLLGGKKVEADPVIEPENTDIIEPQGPVANEVDITEEESYEREDHAESNENATKEDATNAIKFLRDFIGRSQLNAIATAMRGEEKQFFFDKVVELQKQIKSMPKTYDTDGQGEKAVAYLHYFKGSGDWYITEKDAGDDEDAKNGISGQVQAFVMADLGQGGELGYISIKELIEAGVELDLYWTPKTLAAIKGKDDEPETKNEPVPVPANSDVADPSAIGETGQNADAGEANSQPAENQEDTMKDAFIAELETLKAETDIDTFDKRLDDIAARIDDAGLSKELDAELNAAADVLSDLLAKAESA